MHLHILFLLADKVKHVCGKTLPISQGKRWSMTKHRYVICPYILKVCRTARNDLYKQVIKSNNAIL